VHHHYIYGEWTDGQGSITFEDFNPETGESWGEFVQGTE